MSKSRESASRALMAAAKRAGSLALDLRGALLAFEGEPWAGTLVLQARRLASDCEERAVDLGRAPREEDRPIIAAIEARTHQSTADGLSPTEALSRACGGTWDEAAAAEPALAADPPGNEDLPRFPPGTKIPFPVGTWLFRCNRCHLVRRVADGHPCGHCKCPEYGCVHVGPGDTLVSGWPECDPGEDPHGLPLVTYEVLEKPGQEAPGHVQFRATGMVEAIEHARVNWPGMAVRPVPPERDLANQKGSDGRPKTLPETLEAEKRRPRPPAFVARATWSVWDEVRNVELKPVESASEDGARRKARKAHPGLRKIRVERREPAPAP